MSNINKAKDTIMALKNKYKDSSWVKQLYKIIEHDHFEKLIIRLYDDLDNDVSFNPGLKHLFRSMDICTLNAVNVIIINEYPYSDKGVADGLALSTSFDVNKNKWFTKALGNKKQTTDLSYLVEQGVILLNMVPTCPIGNPIGHTNFWKEPMEQFILSLQQERKELIFIFIGKNTEPLSDFVGQGHFKIFVPEITEDWDNLNCFNVTNNILYGQKKHPIEW